MAQTEVLAREAEPELVEGMVKLGIFMPNLGGGASVSSAPTSTRPDFEYNARVAKRAEQLGFDFLLPAARWKGFGGELDNQGEAMECLIWAAAMAQVTTRIGVWSTVHAPLVHPILAAKMGATIQMISGGRWGLNVVTGWNVPEAIMFGLEPLSHQDRHEAAREWVEIVRLLWAKQDFDYVGRHYRVFGGYMAPKPDPTPILMNAGGSPAAREFSAQYMDYYFLSFNTLEDGQEKVRDVQAQAAQYGRSLELYVPLFVIARDTEREARAAMKTIVDNADWVCADNIIRLLNLNVGGSSRLSIDGYASWSQESLEDRLVIGWTQPLIVGTPNQVAEQLADVASVGIHGLMLDWYDYEAELDYFGKAVLPLLQDMGLRAKARSE